MLSSSVSSVVSCRLFIFVPFPFVAVWLCIKDNTDFLFFLLFFVFFCLRRVAGVLPCFGLSRGLVCCGSFYLFICCPWLPLAGSRLACLLRVCGGCLYPVAGCCLSVLSVLSVCLCVPVSAGLALTLSRCVFRRFNLAGFRVACICGRVSSGQLETFEQVFETSVLMPFWVSLSEFPTESDRIFQPNL